jgi:hypothetical protein
MLSAAFADFSIKGVPAVRATTHFQGKQQNVRSRLRESFQEKETQEEA